MSAKQSSFKMIYIRFGKAKAMQGSGSMSCKSPVKEAKTLMILLLRRRRLQRLHPVSCISHVLSFRDMSRHKLAESERNLPLASIRRVFKRLISTQQGSCRTGARVMHSQMKGQRCSVENSKSEKKNYIYFFKTMEKGCTFC